MVFIHERLPVIKIFLFELHKVFYISTQESATWFQVLEHGIAILAEECAVDDIVEGEIQHAVFKTTDALLETLGWK